MRTYKCDICGKTLNQLEVLLSHGTFMEEASFLGVLCRPRNICPTCLEIGRKIDFEQVMIDSWKRKAGVSEEDVHEHKTC